MPLKTTTTLVQEIFDHSPKMEGAEKQWLGDCLNRAHVVDQAMELADGSALVRVGQFLERWSMTDRCVLWSLRCDGIDGVSWGEYPHLYQTPRSGKILVVFNEAVFELKWWEREKKNRLRPFMHCRGGWAVHTVVTLGSVDYLALATLSRDVCFYETDRGHLMHALAKPHPKHIVWRMAGCSDDRIALFSKRKWFTIWDVPRGIQLQKVDLTTFACVPTPRLQFSIDVSSWWNAELCGLRSSEIVLWGSGGAFVVSGDRTPQWITTKCVFWFQEWNSLWVLRTLTGIRVLTRTGHVCFHHRDRDVVGVVARGLIVRTGEGLALLPLPQPSLFFACLGQVSPKFLPAADRTHWQ